VVIQAVQAMLGKDQLNSPQPRPNVATEQSLPVPSQTAVTDAAGKPATTHRGEIMQRSMNVLALVKDSERYVFLYDEDSAASLLQTLGKYAADKDLSFTWYDAAVLSQKVRKLRQEAESEERSNRLPETAW